VHEVRPTQNHGGADATETRVMPSLRTQSHFYSLRPFSLKRFQDVETAVNRHKANVCFLNKQTNSMV
jgi:uncharacterized protein (DUF1800 family)